MKLNLDETVNETWGSWIFGSKYLMVSFLSFWTDIPYRDKEWHSVPQGLILGALVFLIYICQGHAPGC